MWTSKGVAHVLQRKCIMEDNSNSAHQIITNPRCTDNQPTIVEKSSKNLVPSSPHLDSLHHPRINTTSSLWRLLITSPPSPSTSPCSPCVSAHYCLVLRITVWSSLSIMLLLYILLYLF